MSLRRSTTSCAAIAALASAAALAFSTDASAVGFGGGMRGAGGFGNHAMRLGGSAGREFRGLGSHAKFSGLSHKDRVGERAHGRHERDRHDDDHYRRHRHDHLVIDTIPIGDPVIADNSRTVIADGPNDGGKTAEKVEKPCPDGILKVVTARRVCINDVVHISGDKYLVCKSTSQVQIQHYSYEATPRQSCNASTVFESVKYPPGWNDRQTGDTQCHETGRTLVQYSVEGGHWMRITYQVLVCRDANGKDVERLGPGEERVNTLKSADEDPPITPEETK